MEHAICEGRDEIEVDSGYWRSSINSSKIYPCPRVSSCLGGFNRSADPPINCAYGYTGILCQACSNDISTSFMRVGQN